MALAQEVIIAAITYKLYKAPMKKITGLIIEQLKLAAQAQELPENGIYCVVHRGKNYLTPWNASPWTASDIKIPEENLATFDRITLMLESAKADKHALEYHLKRIMMFSETYSDTNILLDGELHNLCTIPTFPAYPLSALAKEYEKEVNDKYPERKQLIKRRQLANAMLFETH